SRRSDSSPARLAACFGLSCPDCLGVPFAAYPPFGLHLRSPMLHCRPASGPRFRVWHLACHHSGWIAVYFRRLPFLCLVVYQPVVGIGRFPWRRLWTLEVYQPRTGLYRRFATLEVCQSSTLLVRRSFAARLPCLAVYQTVVGTGRCPCRRLWTLEVYQPWTGP